MTSADIAAFRRHFAPDGVFVNGYGTTEIGFIAQEHYTDVPDDVRPTIGHPLDGVEVLLDHDEIVVRSRYLALGYVGRPFTRGQRVEPAEIEMALQDLPGVRAAAVAFRDGHLRGYVCGPPSEDYRAAVADRLPSFMVPHSVVVVDELPLTPTGKVDLAALAVPEPDPVTARDAGTALERTVCAASAAELGRPEVVADENVFDLGGHSLLMADVQVRLERELSVRVPLARMLEFPTPASLSEFLAGRLVSEPDALHHAYARCPADADAMRRMARRAARRSAHGGQRHG